VFLPRGIVGSLSRCQHLRRLRRPARVITQTEAYSISRAIGARWPGLVVRGLAKSFRRHSRVERRRCPIKRGTVHGLIGPNGSGKSICQCRNRRLSASAGKIMLGERELPPQGHTAWPSTASRAPPEHSTVVDLSVIDNVIGRIPPATQKRFVGASPADPRGVAEEAAIAARRWPLGARRDAERRTTGAEPVPTANNGAGDRARARGGPQLLMLDEPAAGQYDRAPSPLAHHPRHQAAGRHASRHRAPHGAHHGISDVISVSTSGRRSPRPVRRGARETRGDRGLSRRRRS